MIISAMLMRNTFFFLVVYKSQHVSICSVSVDEEAVTFERTAVLRLRRRALRSVGSGVVIAPPSEEVHFRTTGPL